MLKLNRFISGSAVFYLLLLAGCGEGNKSTKLLKSLNDSNIKRVSTLYTVFQGQHGMRGPKDEGELKSFIVDQGPKALARIGVSPDNVEGLFICERDNQPFKVRYGLKALPRQEPVPIVFESEGVDGKYQVAFSGFICQEVDKSKYDQLWESERDKKKVKRNDLQRNP